MKGRAPIQHPKMKWRGLSTAIYVSMLGPNYFTMKGRKGRKGRPNKQTNNPLTKPSVVSVILYILFYLKSKGKVRLKKFWGII